MALIIILATPVKIAGTKKKKVTRLSSKQKNPDTTLIIPKVNPMGAKFLSPSCG